MDAIPLTPEKWLHYRDVVRDIPEREDPFDLRDTCWRGLERLRGQLRPSTKPDRERARKATGQIVAAKVRRASVGTRKSATDVHERLDEQQAVINRLLAFVPTRAAAIEERRLEEIKDFIIAKARELFGHESQIAVRVVDDVEEDTEACHCIEVDVQHAAVSAVSELGMAAVALHALVASELTPEEYRAIRLLVNPL